MRSRVAAALNVANPSPTVSTRQVIAEAVQKAATFADLPAPVRELVQTYEQQANEQADSIVASGGGEFHLAGRHNQANHGRRKLNPTFAPFTKAQKVARDALRKDNLDPDTPRAWRTPETPAKKIARPRGSIAHPRKGEREQPPIAVAKKVAAKTDAQTAAHVAAKKAAPARAATPAKKVAAPAAASTPDPKQVAADMSPEQQALLRMLAREANNSGGKVALNDVRDNDDFDSALLADLATEGIVKVGSSRDPSTGLVTTRIGFTKHGVDVHDNLPKAPAKKAAAPAAPAVPVMTPPASTRPPTAAAPSARSTNFPPFIDGKTEASDLDAGEADAMAVLKKNIKTTTGSANVSALLNDPKFGYTAYSKLVQRGLVNHGDGGKKVTFTPEGLQTSAALGAAARAAKKAAPSKTAAKKAAPAAPPAPLADLPKTGPQKTLMQGLGRIVGTNGITTWKSATGAQGWNAASRNALEKDGYIEIDRSNPPVKIKLTKKGRDAVDALERGEGNLTDAARRALQNKPAPAKAAPAKAGRTGLTPGQAASAMPSRASRMQLASKDQVGPNGNPAAGTASEKFGRGKGVGDDSIVPSHKNPGDIVSLLTDPSVARGVLDAFDRTNRGQSRDGGNDYLTELSKLQGTSGKPTIGTRAEVDAAIASGAREGWRGVRTPYNGPPPSARKIMDDLRTDTDTYYGNGIYGNGIYIAEEKGYVTGGYSDPNDPYSLVKMAISPNAKVIKYDDLQNEVYAFLRDEPKHPLRHLFQADPAAYALARGYDAIATPSGYNMKTNYNFLNRTALLVEDEASAKTNKGGRY